MELDNRACDVHLFARVWYRRERVLRLFCAFVLGHKPGKVNGSGSWDLDCVQQQISVEQSFTRSGVMLC